MTMKVKAIEKKLKFTKETAKIINGIIIEPDSQLQFNGHAPFAVAEIPDTFSQNGIDHRSDFILCAPYGIVVSHSNRYSVSR